MVEERNYDINRATTLAHKVWMANYKINMIREAKKPKLYLMAGLPLSGKSYLARRIIDKSDASVVYIENDLVRNMIMEQLGYDGPIYTPKENNLVFETSHELMFLALSFSFHTIFDATNLNEKYRAKIYEIADAYDSEILIIRCVIDEKTAEIRSKKKFKDPMRKDHSPADVEIFKKLREEDEPIEECCSRPYIVVDTSKEDVDALIRKHNLALNE